MAQRTVPGSRKRLLCSGFWGVARHVNYLGEILQAAAISMLLLLSVWLDEDIHRRALYSCVALFYPLYYVLLFIPRQADDDTICRGKYGDKVWDEYEKLVPYRIAPFLY